MLQVDNSQCHSHISDSEQSSGLSYIMEIKEDLIESFRDATVNVS